MARLLTQTVGRIEHTVNIGDLNVVDSVTDTPIRIAQTPLLAYGRWYTQNLGKGPPTIQMRGVIPLEGPNAAAAEAARAELDAMAAREEPLNYLDRTETKPLSGPVVVSERHIHRVFISRWRVHDPDLVNGVPIARRRWQLSLSVIDPQQA